MNELTISTVEAEAARRGIILTAEDYAVAQQAMDARREQLAAEQAATQPDKAAAWVDTFNKWYPRFLKVLIGVGDVAISLTQTILIAFGVPLVLAMLMLVEQQRTEHGIGLFEVHGALAAFSAWSLVILNLVLELLISYIEHRQQYVEPPKYRFSLALVGRRLRYMIGGQAFQAEATSPAVRFRAVLRIVTFAILALALAGSMKPALASASGNWFDALRAILTDSSLLEMTTWIGGLLFALAAVLAAQALSKYVATKMIEVVAIMSSATDNKFGAALEAVGASGAAALMARLKEKSTLRRQAAAAPAVALEALAEETIPAVPVRPEPARIPPATAKALAWLDAHPNQSGSIRELADASGFSRTTIQRAKALLRERAQ